MSTVLALLACFFLSSGAILSAEEIKMEEVKAVETSIPDAIAEPLMPQISLIPVPATTLPIAKPAATKEAFPLVSDYVKARLIRYPMYNYQTGKQWYLSKTEKIVVDAYLKTNNETEATRVLNAIRGAHGSTKFFRVQAISKWLKKPHVSQYIAEQQVSAGKVNWYDKEKWFAYNVDVQQGKIPATATMMKAWESYGEAKGWYAEKGPSIQNNTQINFTQSDGKA